MPVIWLVNYVVILLTTHVRSAQPGRPFVVIGAMSTNVSWSVDRHTARCTRLVLVVSQCKLVSS